MDWRWVAAATSASTSFSLVALGTFAVVSASALEPKKPNSAPSLISASDATSSADVPRSGLQLGSAFAASNVRTSSVIVTTDDVRVADGEGFEPLRLSSEATHEANALGYAVGSLAPDDAMIQIASASEPQTVSRGKTPAVPADHSGLSKSRSDGARPYWDIAKARPSGRLNSNQARYCQAFEPAVVEKGKQQIAIRRASGEEHISTRIALVLGVAF
jgi:hypothetical protein